MKPLYGTLLFLTFALGGFSQSISTVQFTAASYFVNENAGSVTLTVQRIGEPDGYAFVEFATHDGSATNGSDYVAQSGYLEFAGETNLTIEIVLVNDALGECDEDFS